VLLSEANLICKAMICTAFTTKPYKRAGLRLKRKINVSVFIYTYMAFRYNTGKYNDKVYITFPY
jgi:hypothetical protein